MNLIVVKNLEFGYPSKKILKDLTFTIQEGGITALVGPNGAGKTTLLRCLTSLETPLSGTVTIGGIDVHDEPREAHRHIGYLSDSFGLYDELSVRQCLTYMAWCHKIPTQNLTSKIESIAADVDITKYLDEKAGTLSRGYRQRLGVALTLVHDPKLLILDEPASGMDPEARIAFSELMLRLKARGMTIIVSSHILAELEDYCTDMLVIRDGEIKTHVILKEHQKQTETTLHIAITMPDERYQAVLASFEGIHNIKATPEGIDCTAPEDENLHAALLAYLVKNDVPVRAFIPEKKTLTAAYMDIAAEKERTAP